MKVPTTFKMLIAISLIQSSHAAYYAYSTIYWASQGFRPKVQVYYGDWQLFQKFCFSSLPTVYLKRGKSAI